MQVWNTHSMNKTIVGSLTLILLALAGCKEQGSKDGKKEAKDEIQEVKITILEHECDPMELTIKAGKTRFLINNQSQRAVEWEILKGVRIIDERENIPPGFTQKMTTVLDPDTYEMACGLLSNPRGKLIVTAAADGSVVRKPTPIELVGAVAEYKVYVNTEFDALMQQTQKLSDAVKAGNLKEAQALYAPTLQHYEHIEPVLKQFSDLDRAISANENMFETKAADPKFAGFHKIERGLFEQKSTKDLAPVVDQLLVDLKKLQKEVTDLKIPVNKMVDDAIALVREIDQTKLNGSKNLYAKTDLWGVQANLDGAHRIIRLVRPMLIKSQPDLEKAIDADFKAIGDILKKNQTKEQQFVSYDVLSQADKVKLRTHTQELLNRLTELPQALGLN